VKCENCGFEAPIQEWKMIEESRLVKLPEKIIKEYEQFVDNEEDIQPLMKTFIKFIFRLLAESGYMPSHTTNFACPRCGAMAGKEKNEPR